MAEATKKKEKVRTQAQKRILQNEKKRLINKAFRSKIKTAMRHFEDSLKSGKQESINEHLSSMYSLMDNAVKRGVFKLGKASRLKSRLTAQAHRA